MFFEKKNEKLIENAIDPLLNVAAIQRLRFELCSGDADLDAKILEMKRNNGQKFMEEVLNVARLFGDFAYPILHHFNIKQNLKINSTNNMTHDANILKYVQIQFRKLFGIHTIKPSNWEESILVDQILSITQMYRYENRLETSGMIIYSNNTHSYVVADVPLRLFLSALLTEVLGVKWSTSQEEQLLQLLMRRAETKSVDDFNQRYLTFGNGDLDFSTFKIVPWNANHMTTLRSDVSPIEQATPNFDYFLKSTFNNDEERNFVMQFYGNLYAPTNKANIVLFAFSEGASGKTVFLNIARELVADRNTVGLNVHSLGNRFGYEPLIGKMLAVSDETSGVQQLPVSDIKRLAESAAPFSIERKNKTNLDVRLRVKLAFATNTLPPAEAVYGFSRRVRLLLFPNRFTNKADPQLGSKIQHELDGIAWKAIQSLKNLAHDDYRVIEPETMKNAKKDWLNSMQTKSIVERFMTEKLVASFGSRVVSKEIYEEFVSYYVDKQLSPEGITTPSAFWRKFGELSLKTLHVKYGRSKAHGGVSMINDIKIKE